MNKILKKIFSNRKLRYGSSAIVIMIALVALFVIVNLLSGLLAFEKDLTPEKLYSIGDKSDEILSNVDKEVFIYGMFDETKIAQGDDYTKIMDLLKKYDSYENITVDYVDPEVDLKFVNKLDPNRVLNIQMKNFVVVSGDKKRVLKYYDLFESIPGANSFEVETVGSKAETAFTSAVNYVARDKKTTIYFTEGHDEFSPDYKYITATEQLELNGYDVDTINLYTEEIPDDASIILIANPTKDFYKEEIDALRNFMGQGKSVYIMVDSSDTKDRFDNLQSFIGEYNVELGYNRVKEGDSNYYIEGNRYYLFPELMDNFINDNIADIVSKVLVPNARSVNVLRKNKHNLDIQPLMVTSDKTALEAMYDDIDDESRAAYLGVAVHDMADDSRLIVSGTASFMLDTILIDFEQYSQDASAFMINNLNWLEGEAGKVLIEEKAIFENRVNITAKQAQTVLIVVVYILPSIILLTGLFIYLRRRHL